MRRLATGRAAVALGPKHGLLLHTYMYLHVRWQLLIYSAYTISKASKKNSLYLLVMIHTFDTQFYSCGLSS